MNRVLAPGSLPRRASGPEGGSGGLRRWASNGVRWTINHGLVLAVGLAAAVQVIVSTVRALLAGWTPVFDDAIIATRSFDVLSSHSPLAGEHSDASLHSFGPIFSPGPLLNWLLALPTHLPGNWALPMTMGVVNTTAIIGAVALARRRGGLGLMFATALAVAVMCHALPQEVLHAPDNSKAGLLVFTLLLFLAWSVACGDYRLLPLTALVASLVLQAHLSLALPSAGVLVVAMVGLTISLVRGRTSPHDARRHRAIWLVAALGVALACWSVPLVDLAIHPPGNLVRIVQTTTAHQQTISSGNGWRALVKAVGIPPWWLRAPPGASRFVDLATSPSITATASCVLVIVGLLTAGLFGLRRRRFYITAATTLALVLCAAIVVYVDSTPVRLFLPLIVYGLNWCSPAGMFVWLALASSGVVLLTPAGWRAPRGFSNGGRSKPDGTVTGLAFGVAAVIGILASVNSQPDAFQWLYRSATAVTSRITARIPRHSSVLVLAGSFPAFAVQEALIYQLRRSGDHPLAPTQFGESEKFGAYYSGHQPHDEVLFVGDSNTPAPANARTLVTVTVRGAPRSLGQSDKPPPTRIIVSIL